MTPTNTREQTLAAIAEQIDAGTYHVPAEEIAGAMLTSERCPMHPGFEFPAFMDCPKCEAVKVEGRRIAHFKTRDDWRQASGMEDDTVELHTQDKIDWDWLATRLIRLGLTILVLVFFFCLWMGAQNEALKKEHGQQQTEVSR